MVGLQDGEEVAPVAAAAVDLSKWREAANGLNALLARFDPSAFDFPEANRVVLQPLFAGERWAEFEKLGQGYPFLGRKRNSRKLQEACQRHK